MKKTIYIILAIVLTFPALTSCEKYLDKSPDLGLDENDIYKNFESVRGFLDECYDHMYPWMRWKAGENGQTDYMIPLCHTDEMTAPRQGTNFIGNVFNIGNWFYATDTYKWEVGMSEGTDDGNIYIPVYLHCVRAIRIANRVIANIDKVVEITDTQRKQILGQAYFYRAWFYFQLINRWGGMPILDKVFAGGDDNIPRVNYREGSEWLVSDLDKAIELLPDLWPETDFCRPDKAAAMAVRAEALLYQASPLFQNPVGKTTMQEYDKEVLLEAAKAAMQVLAYINTTETGRHFTNTGNMDDYRHIFYTPSANDYAHEEYLWWNRLKNTTGNQDRTCRMLKWLETCSQTGAVAQQVAAPSYNITRYFERKGADGIYYPITDPRSGYVEDDLSGATPSPWSNFQERDPRLYNAVLLPGERWGFWKGTPYYISLWDGGSGYTGTATHKNNSRGFSALMLKKYQWWQCSSYWNGTADDANGSYLYMHKSFYIRVTEMYLNYAEALFEATGSATTAPAGFTMTPEEALNIVRARVGVTPVVSDYLTPDKFRETYRRERTVELVFEDHRWIDLRRWMAFADVFPTVTPIYGFHWTCQQENGLKNMSCAAQNNIIYTKYREPNDGDGTYTGQSQLTFTYTVWNMPAEERVFNSQDNRYYLYPFQGQQMASLTELVQNPGW